ncbi:MAG: hypothetical protein GC192_16695 [Bacteroidetes bacterium]|nr:hypothetical protein [Bacteroidota bacterium]
MKTEKKSALERLGAPTPKFFQTIRNWGLVLGAIGGTLVAAPVSLPAWLLAAAKALVVAGTVAAGVSQAAVKGDE